MASVVWSCPQYRDPHLCQKQLSRDHVASDDVITAKDWVTGGNNHCFVCISPSQQPPVQGCFCNSATRPKGLPAAMKVIFSSPLVCAGDSDSGQDIREEDWLPHEEPGFYPNIGTGFGQTSYHPQTPVSRRSRVPRPFTPDIEYAPFTVRYTYDWVTSVPSMNLSEMTVRNPLSYIDDAVEKNIARQAMSGGGGNGGSSCRWVYGEMTFDWAYWHHSVWNFEKRNWKLTRAPQYADWIAYIANNTVYGYLPDTPPNSLTHLADLTRVNNFPPPAMLYGDLNTRSYWLWERHYIKNGWGNGGYYYAVPMEEIGVLQPTHLISCDTVNILEPSAKSEGSVSLNTGNVWDLVAMVSGVSYSYSNTGSNLRPLNSNQNEQVTLRSSINPVPAQAIGPLTNPIPGDNRVSPVGAYPAATTFNAWWSGYGVSNGYYFIASTFGREIWLQLFCRIYPYKIGKVTVENYLPRGALSAFQNSTNTISRNSLVTTNLGNFPESNVYWQQSGRTWHSKSILEEQGNYEEFTNSQDPLNTGGTGSPVQRRIGKKPPGYIGVANNTALATWTATGVPCNKTGVVELTLRSTYQSPLPGPGVKRIGPISIPQYAYLDIGDSGVQ